MLFRIHKNMLVLFLNNGERKNLTKSDGFIGNKMHTFTEFSKSFLIASNL